VTVSSKIVDVLLPLGTKQHSCVQAYLLCLHYTLCLMRLSVVRNLILEGCSDDIPASGFLVIDAVGLRSMYFVVMPRVSLIVILVILHTLSLLYQLSNYNLFTQHVLFILWRDTTSELWTPVQFPLHCYTVLLYSHYLLYLHTIILLSLDTLIPLFTANR
jgi:hypothetical protein